MASLRADILIIGAGVIGLTTAIRLAERARLAKQARPYERDLRIMIYRSQGPDTTSSYAAGAIFDPYMAEHKNDDLRDKRAEATRREFENLHSEGHVWARLLEGIEASRTPLSPPKWAPQLPRYRPCSRAELPPGFRSGWRYQSPLIEMPPFLDWLEQRLRSLGVKIEKRELKDLDQGFADADIVVNCTGIGARTLVPDNEVRPIRGQLVAVPNPGIREFFVEHVRDSYIGDTTYVLPHGDTLLLGGSAELGVSDLRWNSDAEEAIMRRCRAAFPVLAHVDPIDDFRRVGIRPHRETVRLEHEDFGERHLVHNYGHGGSGVSLSWGCADEVADIVADIHKKPRLSAPTP
ncbi:FAD-dependent oxidoreductase [Actinoplanes sp. M2I2]|uniref:FAD-dependent oxidoreductase n=1 Tax=Actinoplanes sp. M2I2 TaxID=1734444 RepID=UPI0020221E89|nr:FAD-dependent oxidoreductase [Actinoplanes sp. M2I2]